MCSLNYEDYTINRTVVLDLSILLLNYSSFSQHSLASSFYILSISFQTSSFISSVNIYLETRPWFTYNLDLAKYFDLIGIFIGSTRTLSGILSWPKIDTASLQKCKGSSSCKNMSVVHSVQLGITGHQSFLLQNTYNITFSC